MTERKRCAVYARKSTDEGLEQDFNSLDAQREACEAFIASQRHEGWILVRDRFDDGGYSGGSMDRPALGRLLEAVRDGRIDIIVVYKVDRLTRALGDFAKMVETFDAAGVSFVSVTQQFNTTTSMGRLTLNVLLSFAQFEREVTAERIRDKIAASKKKGMWMGGVPPFGYDAVDKKLVVNTADAETVRTLFDVYLTVDSIRDLKRAADDRGIVTKARHYEGKSTGGVPFTRGHLQQLLRNPVYVGNVAHKGDVFEGRHDAIVDQETWDAVQQKLNDKAQSRRLNTNEKQHCLLGGLVFDETGKRLTPAYGVNHGKRYRYYVSKSEAGWRIPMAELDRVVTDIVVEFLSDEQQLIEAGVFPSESPSKIAAACKATKHIVARLRSDDEMSASPPLTEIVERVDIAPETIHVTLRRAWIPESLGQGDDGLENTVRVERRVAMQRRGVESKLVIHGDKRAAKVDEKLVSLIADAHQWFGQITGGEVSSVRELAKQVGVDEGDVSRFLPLAFLAPEIVETILDGRQSVSLTAEALKRIGGLPWNWTVQRRSLSVSSESNG